MSLDIALTATRVVSVYSDNITHNLGNMADEAGLYKFLWMPEEMGIETAQELILPLQMGLDRLKENPEHYRRFNANNGWGVYENFVKFVEDYLNACIENRDAKVSVSR